MDVSGTLQENIETESLAIAQKKFGVGIDFSYQVLLCRPFCPSLPPQTVQPALGTCTCGRRLCMLDSQYIYWQKRVPLYLTDHNKVIHPNETAVSRLNFNFIHSIKGLNLGMLVFDSSAVAYSLPYRPCG